jgi:catechol 2,3-dioxygenase-like lactoylglutathione lyase family enzyme
MIDRLSHACVWVLDQDEALDFYTTKLGFEVRSDERMESFRWLTVGPPGQPDLEILLASPGPPMLDPESAETMRKLVAKGSLGAGVFATDDCRRTYAVLSERGVRFLMEPTERFYGVEATFRDNSGNWFSLTERADVAATQPAE